MQVCVSVLDALLDASKDPSSNFQVIDQPGKVLASNSVIACDSIFLKFMQKKF